jgi:hypothetical protein
MPEQHNFAAELGGPGEQTFSRFLPAVFRRIHQKRIFHENQTNPD